MNIVIRIPDDTNLRILSFPFVQSLYHHFLKEDNDNLNIHLIGHKDNIELFNLLPFEAFYHELETEDLQNIFTVHRALNQFPILAADYYIDLTSSFVNASIGFWLKAKQKIGFKQGFNAKFFNKTVELLQGRNPIDNYNNLATSFLENYTRSLKTLSREFDRREQLERYVIIHTKEDKISDWTDYFDLHHNFNFLLLKTEEDFDIPVSTFNKNNSYKIINKEWITLSRNLSFCDAFVTDEIELLNLSCYVGAYCLFYNHSKNRIDLEGPIAYMGSFVEYNEITSLQDNLYRLVTRETVE